MSPGESELKSAIESIDDLEKKLAEISDMGRALFEQHRILLQAARDWAIAWRSLDAVRAYVRGSTYKPEEE
jgi:hypothetical protein